MPPTYRAFWLGSKCDLGGGTAASLATLEVEPPLHFGIARSGRKVQLPRDRSHTLGQRRLLVGRVDDPCAPDVTVSLNRQIDHDETRLRRTSTVFDGVATSYRKRASHQHLGYLFVR